MIESALTHGAYGLGVLALVLVLAFAVGRRISAPISALARASHAFGEGKQDVRATVSGAREVAEVAAQLNSMFSILVARERTLVETQEMLDILLDSMDRVLWSFTPDMSTVLFASESTRKVFGHDSSAFRANPGLWLELMHPDDRKLVEATADRIALSGTGAMEYRVLRPDGETRWVEVRWRHAAGGQGKTARMDGLVTDITERKQTEEENRQLLSIIEQSLNEIYVFDAATLSYEYANSSALHNLGYAFRHLRLLTPVDLMPQFTEGTVVGMVNQLLHREKPQQVFETTHRRADGSEYPVEVHLQTVEREGRWKCLAVVIDISERQHAHTEIIKLANSLERRVADRTTELARANAELESFVYSISHDLRTPLRAINGYAHILAEDLKERLDPGALAMLQRIAQGAVRMGELIDDLLTFSRVGRGDLSLMQVDMEAMARAIVEELRHENPQAQVSIQDMPKPVADPKLLRQVMLNLIGNALKFSSRQAEARIEIGSISEDGKPMYFVRDNGAGFDSAHASKAVRRFSSACTRSPNFPAPAWGWPSSSALSSATTAMSGPRQHRGRGPRSISHCLENLSDGL
ncbi:MAG: PAS domain S-box protein [Betaproteobacteria bacterium]|nr:PAS domain S-box protein [Betaproteobacteria bacterium]